MPSALWIIAALAAVALLTWELWICEGAHFGRRFVAWLYEISARRYDGIKQFDPDWERRFLGESVANALGGRAGGYRGKTIPRTAVRDRLSGLGLEDVEVDFWQVDYDLVWARKAMPAGGRRREPGGERPPSGFE